MFPYIFLHEFLFIYFIFFFLRIQHWLLCEWSAVLNIIFEWYEPKIKNICLKDLLSLNCSFCFYFLLAIATDISSMFCFWYAFVFLFIHFHFVYIMFFFFLLLVVVLKIKMSIMIYFIDRVKLLKRNGSTWTCSSDISTYRLKDLVHLIQTRTHFGKHNRTMKIKLWEVLQGQIHRKKKRYRTTK